MGNKITIGLIFITLGTIFYFNFVKQEIEIPESLIVQTATTEILGKQIATALNKLNSLSLDTSIFSEPGYISLVTFHQEINPLPAGKRNPFFPIDSTNFDPLNGGPTQRVDNNNENFLEEDIKKYINVEEEESINPEETVSAEESDDMTEENI